MKFKKTLLNIALAIFVSSLILLLSEKGLLKRAELAGLDLSFQLRGPLPFNPHIVIIEITDGDIAVVGRWPWKRSWHATMTKALCDLGAKDIYFDIIFSEASSEAEDALLQEALKKAQNVYFPFVFQENSLKIENALLPISRFASYIKGSGTINIYPDIDGTFRRIPLVFPGEKEIYPHVALKIAADYTGLAIKAIKPSALILANKKKELKIPLDEKNRMLVNWSGKWQNTFMHYSFLDVLAAYKDSLENKKPKINLESFKDSICLVAVTAIGLYDIRSVPLQPEYPGIGIIATAISNILNRNFLHPVPSGINIVILYLLGLLPAFLIFGEKPLRETIFVFLAAAVYFLANLLLFQRGVVINFSRPLLGLAGNYLVVATYNFVRVSMERQSFFKMSITDGLTGLFNIAYFKMLLETEFMLTKSDPNRKFSIVMLDVDHFKQFNDTYGHQTGDLVLKEVAGALKGSVRSSDIVARYGGEEMIVLLRGTPLKNALRVAEKIRKNIEGLLIKDRVNTYKVTVSLGVSSFKPGYDVERIIKRADEGLYKAKNSGRNRVETEEGLDELAALYDAQRFHEILAAECQTAKKELNKKFCIIIAAIDNLPHLMATYDSRAVELILEEVANILENSVRSSDIVAEYEKDKMIVLLRGASLKDSLHIAEKIRKNVEKSVIKDGANTYKATLSLGVSSFKRQDEADALMQRANEALDKAKNIGGNRSCSV